MSHTCSAEQVRRLEKCLERILSRPEEAREWVNVDECVHACAELIWLAGELPKVLDLSKATNIGGAGTIRRFYNETVSFIEGGQRKISVECWMGIVNDICTTGTSGGQVGQVGTTLTFMPKTLTGINTAGIEQSGISLNLLSYAHHELLSKWIQRERGLDDAVLSLRCLAQIYQRFYSDSNTNVVNPQ